MQIGGVSWLRLFQRHGLLPRGACYDRPPPLAAPATLRIGVGIDTARYGHHATFLRDDRQKAAPCLSLPETAQGYQQLRDRLELLHRKHRQAELRVHVDAAGQYATNLIRFLQTLDLSLVISVGESKRNKDFHNACSPSGPPTPP